MNTENEMLNSQTLGQDWGQTYKWAFVLRIKYYTDLIRRVPGFSKQNKNFFIWDQHHDEKVCAQNILP